MQNFFPDTSLSLIAEIRDPANVSAWKEFERIYRPVIFRIARAKGMQYADAFDLVQQVLMSVAGAIPNYEQRDSGPPFRNWLSRITRNAIMKALSRQPRDQADGGSRIQDILSEVSSSDSMTDSLIELELRREIFLVAAQQVRQDVQSSTWLAFELTVIQGQSIERVAQRLELSFGNVYAARSRVMKRLRQVVERLEGTPAYSIGEKNDET